MNYANVFGRTQKQFDMTMNREKITVTDFFNSDTKYDVFFRRNQRSTTPQGKVRFFYAQSTPIDIGTIFVLNGSNFIVTSKDGIESNIYFTSLAVKCDTTFVVQSENKYIDVPMSVVSDKWTVAHGSVFSMVNGAVAMFTQDNPIAKPYEFADIIDAMGRWYNKGLLVVEKASGGHSCIERLRYDKKYMNMYKYKCYDEFKRTIWKVGFDTNNKTNCSLDYNSIKLYLDNMKQFLNDVACMPSVLGSSTNIANISEVSMQILLMMASVYADENKKWLNIGFQKRFEMFKKILGMQGIKVDSDVEVIYNVAMPVASTEMIANLKTLQEMGAISKETIMEKTEYVSDVEVEKKRLSGENVSQDVSQKVDNPSKKVEIK